MAAVLQTSVKNGKAYSLSGFLAGMGGNIAYTATVTVNIANLAGIPYGGNYDAYYGSLAQMAAVKGATTWDNPELLALGGPYLTQGVGVWAGLLNTTASETIAYSFSAPIAAGASFLLVDPGASYPSYTGSFTYRISATHQGAPVSIAGWSFTTLSATAGATSGAAITVNAIAGTVTVSSYAATNWPDTLIAITPNTPITGLSITATTIPYDFWALIPPHLPSALLFVAGNAAPAFSGTLATWQINGATLTGGGGLSNPGVGWTYEGSGAFDNSGATALLFRHVSGAIAYWTVSGTKVVSSVGVASPSGVWQIKGLADFNNDGLTDLLFQDLAGELVIWLMNGATTIGGGLFAKLAVGAAYIGCGDFNGDGASDLLIRNFDGSLEEWRMQGAAVTAKLALGKPPLLVYAGAGDFDGNGRSDILMKNPATGSYEAWLTAPDGTVAASKILAAPGLGQALVSIDAYTTTGVSDLVIQNGKTGVLSLYAPDVPSLAGGAAIGPPGLNYWVATAPYRLPALVESSIYFANATGSLAHWYIPRGRFAGDAFITNALKDMTFIAPGDFTGFGRAGFLARTAAGSYAVYDTDGGQIAGGGVLGALSPGWSYAGVGDFNGDGVADVLFVSDAGSFASWLVNGAKVLDVANLGSPGAGYALAAVADLNGNGVSDLVLRDANGAYRAWFVSQGAFAGTAPIGTADAGNTLLGAGDFNGDGKSDLLFSSGPNLYSTWDMNGAAIVGGGSFAGPGTDWAVFGFSELSGNGCASIVFRSVSTGGFTVYDMNDASVALIHNLPPPAAGWASIAVI